ncbi:MAG: MoxR family ATPase [Myxococcota bacterium]
MEPAEASVGPNLVIERTIRDVSQIVRGKPEAVRLCVMGLLARGHVLLEDVPGVGKTTLARALAESVGGGFGRVQMTADLLPADIIGGPVLDRSSGELNFRPGPIFNNVVLADELNRATPRTQSGLLEAMAERSVSVDGRTHALPEPFFVIATQNPSDHHGVYRLPQSQLDRFLVRTSLGYPDEETELQLLLGEGATPSSEPRLTQDVLARLQTAVDQVRLESSVAKYLRSIADRTRAHAELEIGVSTRGLLALGQAARARALMEGRDFVSPDDVRALVVPVLAHRVVVAGGRGNEREEAEALLEEIANAVEPPV